MSSILKNILLFTLTAGQSSAQPHLLNNNEVAKVPRNVYLDGAGFVVSADATNVSVTRGANAASTVKVECEGWHSYEDAEPLPNGIAASLFPMVIQGAGSGGGGGITALSAGTLTGTGPTVVFGNGGGITFGLAGNTITASVQTAGGTATGVGITAGTQSAGTGAVLFDNGNGVSFGMSNSSVVTASVAAGATATGNFGALAAGTQTAASGTVLLANSNGLSFGMSGSTAVTASFSREAVLAVNGAGSITAGTAVLSNSNNVTFGLNGSTITASASFAAETPFGMSAGTQSVSTGTVSFGNGSGVSFGMAGSNVITASVAAGATATGNFGAFAAGTQTATSGTVALVNSNGLTFGMSGSTGITASVSREPSISIDGAGVISAGTVVFSNGGNVTFGLAGSTITANGPAAGTGGGIALAAGTQTATSGTVVLSASNQMFFTMNGSTQILGRALQLSATAAGEVMGGNHTAGVVSFFGSTGIFNGASVLVSGDNSMAIRAGTDINLSAARSLSATIVSDASFNVGRHIVLAAGSSINLLAGGGALTVKATAGTIGFDQRLSIHANSSGISLHALSSGITAAAPHTNGVFAVSVGSQVQLLAGTGANVVVDDTNGVQIQVVSNGKLGFHNVAAVTRQVVSSSSDLTAWVSRIASALSLLGLISQP